MSGEAVSVDGDAVAPGEPVRSVSIGYLTIGTLGEERPRRPLLDRNACVRVEVVQGSPWTSQLVATAPVLPDQRERLALALAPWLCPLYMAEQLLAAGTHLNPVPVREAVAGHGLEGACPYQHCRSVTTRAMLELS